MRRREFIRRTGYAGAAILTPSLSGLVACTSADRPRLAAAGSDYGPLVRAGAELSLPEGFEYRMFGVEGDIMSDGQPTPRAHDGMGAFPGADGLVRLVRNHEDTDPPGRARPLGPPELAWDPLAGGGTTSLDVRIAADGAPELVRDFASLSGTFFNCAGGITPWGTWLSCEERSPGPADGWERPHGYVFEVPAEADEMVVARPLPALGRMRHEAVAIDPETGIVYLTEDMNRMSGMYRFVPDEEENLAAGHLQMMAIVDRPQLDLRRGHAMGDRFPVEWVDIERPNPPEADREPSAVYQQGAARGGARFTRLEGCWYGDESIYFHSTNGGAAGLGQVWRYLPRANPAELVLVFESDSREVLDSPDNITVSPRGGVVICEDASGAPYIRGLTRDGQVFDFARNEVNRREFAGACFSPDGSVLFVNIQGDVNSFGPGNLGMTFGIWGPWQRGAL